MRKFADKTGDGWELKLNVRRIAAVRDALGIDMLKLDANPFGRIAADYAILGGVLYVLCEQQATDRGLTPEAFADRFDGDALERAMDALLLEWIDFFPHRTRAVLHRVRTLSVEKAEAEAVQLERLLAIVDSTAGRKFGCWRVRSAWTRILTRCASWFGWHVAGTGASSG